MDRKIEKKKWTVKKVAYLSGGALVFAVIMYSVLFADYSSKYNVDREKITVSVVKEDKFQEYIPVSGTVVPINSIFLDAVEGGRVEEIYVEGGNLVQKGDRILRLSNSRLQLEVMNREAQLYEQINNLRSTRITMEQFKLDLSQQVLDIEYQLRERERSYRQNSELWEKGLVSNEEYLKSKDDAEYYGRLFRQKKEKQEQDLKLRDAQVNQLESSVGNLQNNLEIIRENLENLTIKAPVTGQLASLNADIGEIITSGTRFGQIDVLDGYKIRVPIDEHYITRVNLDQKGEVDFAGKKYELRINKIYPEVREGRFEVDMKFTGAPPEDIRRGQNLQVKLELGNLTKTMLLSRGGFYQSSGGNWAFVLDKSGETAVKREIRLGRQNPEYFEVLDGLESGDMVITSSYDNFGDAEKIVLKEE